MKVVDKRKQDLKTMNELPIGQAYLDSEGILCIKTREEDNGYCSCLAYVNNEWKYDEEFHNAKVTPISITLTINN